MMRRAMSDDRATLEPIEPLDTTLAARSPEEAARSGHEALARSVRKSVVRSCFVATAMVPLIGVPFAYVGTPVPGNGVDAFLADSLQLVPYVPLAGLLLALSWWVFLPAYRLLKDGTALAADRAAAVVAQPRRQAVLTLGIWAVNLPIALGTNGLFYPPGTFPIQYTLAVGGVAILAGLASAAICYVVVDRALRPAYAVVLPGQSFDRVRGGGLVWGALSVWVIGSGLMLFLAPLVLLMFGPGEWDQVNAAVRFISAGGFVIGLVVMTTWARTLGERLNALGAGMRDVRQGRYETRVSIDDAGELGHLQTGFNEMVDGLRERERIREVFGKQVGPQAARYALERGVHLEGERRQVSTLFVDVIGSTGLAEKLPPEEVVGMLNRFFDAVVDTVGRHGGWVNKFEGDGALCLFGAPADHPGHATGSLRAARALRAEIAALQRSFPALDAAIAVTTGEVVAGNIGTESRFEYSVIGDSVNQAARLTVEAKSRPSRVVVGQSSILAADKDEAKHWREVGEVVLRGRTEPTVIFEPI
jgi:adenylate cyclase